MIFRLPSPSTSPSLFRRLDTAFKKTNIDLKIFCLVLYDSKYNPFLFSVHSSELNQTQRTDTTRIIHKYNKYYLWTNAKTRLSRREPAQVFIASSMTGGPKLYSKRTSQQRPVAMILDELLLFVFRHYERSSFLAFPCSLLVKRVRLLGGLLELSRTETVPYQHAVSLVSISLSHMRWFIVSF